MDIFSKSFLIESDFKTILEAFEFAFNKTYLTLQYRFNPNYLYRGRRNWDNNRKLKIDLYENISELWAPPEVPDLPQGRCNLPGQSLFYCTQNCAAILFELDAQPEELITIGVYKCQDEMFPLGINGAGKISTIDEQHFKIFKDHYNNLSLEHKFLQKNVDKLFRETSTKFYNASNAITSIFLNNNTNLEQILGNIAPPNFVGFIYSSVATKLNTYNIVLQPNYAKTALLPIEFHRYKIIERPTPNHYVIQKTHSSNDIETDGKINWLKNKPSIIEYITDIPKLVRV